VAYQKRNWKKFMGALALLLASGVPRNIIHTRLKKPSYKAKLLTVTDHCVKSKHVFIHKKSEVELPN
jgi:hypothetical protein